MYKFYSFLFSLQEQCVKWIVFQKRKWLFQSLQRNVYAKNKKNKSSNTGVVLRDTHSATLGGFLQRAQRNLLILPWQVLQITPLGTSGEFRLWALVIKL